MKGLATDAVNELLIEAIVVVIVITVIVIVIVVVVVVARKAGLQCAVFLCESRCELQRQVKELSA